MIVLSTAHPAKFPEAMERACGLRPPLPDWLADLEARPEHFVTLPVDQTAVESHILSLSRAAQQGAAA
jgi:threonine synthase